jgi:nucleoside-diphosphate-sugar epimerase/dTDP-4-dehydrorhamnose 3,5-epimerase-like enzyme
MQTVCNTELITFFDKKVIVQELREFGDSRGFLCELWRIDDEFTIDNNCKMCYYSHTNPLVMRGPHCHTNQRDVFITIKSHMLYMFVYNNVPTYFITNPNKIYRISVDPGVIHSYRNLSISSVSFTANFPTSLFMGMNKKEEIDEIRYEPQVEKNKTIFLLGADGRLGKHIVKQLLGDMGLHTYHVVPITDIITQTNIHKLYEHILSNRTSENDIIINCIAKTKVQDEHDDFMFPNYDIPKQLTEFCLTNKMYFVHFSTDYVYQTGELSKYTLSKKAYEDWFNDVLLNISFIPHHKETIKHYIKIIRLANLFSLDIDDIHNMINKFYNKCANTEDIIVIPKHLRLMPTDVGAIAVFMSKYIHDISTCNQYINLSGKAYTVEQILDKFFKINHLKIEELTDDDIKVINNPNLYLDSKHYLELDCDDAIIQKIKQLKE